MEGLEDELTCPVCLDLYTCPLLLPCQHNLCRRCAEEFLKTPLRKPDGAQAACSWELAPTAPEKTPTCFECPTCREEVHLGDRGVDGLRRNQMLQNIIDRFKQVHAQSQKLNRRAVACLVCDVAPPRDAVKSCTTCKLSYCGDCLKLLHPSRGGLADHQLVTPVESFDDLKKAVMCPDHKNKPVELYCMEDNTPVCSLCKLVGKHKQHDMAALEEVFESKKNSLQEIADEVGGKIEQETKKIKKLENKKAAMQSHAAQVKSQIQTEYDELIDIINERKLAAMARVDEVVGSDTARIQTFIDSSNEKVKVANSSLAYTKEAIKETDPACFLQTEQLVRSRVEKSSSAFVHDEQHTLIPTDRMWVDLDPVRSWLEGLDLPSVPSISPEQCSIRARDATISWDASDHNSKFDVLYCSESAFSLEQPRFIPDIQGNSCKMEDLEQDTSYTVTVISKNSCGTAEGDSVSVKTKAVPVQKTIEDKVMFKDADVENDYYSKGKCIGINDREDDVKEMQMKTAPIPIDDYEQCKKSLSSSKELEESSEEEEKDASVGRDDNELYMWKAAAPVKVNDWTAVKASSRSQSKKVCEKLEHKSMGRDDDKQCQWKEDVPVEVDEWVAVKSSSRSPKSARTKSISIEKLSERRRTTLCQSAGVSESNDRKASVWWDSLPMARASKAKSKQGSQSVRMAESSPIAPSQSAVRVKEVHKSQWYSAKTISQSRSGKSDHRTVNTTVYTTTMKSGPPV